MFTANEKTVLIEALMARKVATERAKAKSRSPRFAVLYDEDIKVLAALTMKVQALEENDGKGKVASRP